MPLSQFRNGRYIIETMGIIETRVKSRARKQNIRRAVLTTISAAGVLALAMAAPNTLRLLKYAPGMKSRYTSRAQRTLERLIAQGYLEKRTGGRKNIVQLTKRGETLLGKLSVGSAKYRPPEKWDGKWRIVIFDIPEQRRKFRDYLRMMLETIGFHMLQASVWVYPHDCEDLILLLKTDFSLGKEVLYIVAEDIEGDYILRRHFHLK